MAGIMITLEVDDKGTVKVKQFADESKKAFDEIKKGPEAAKGPLASLQEGWIGLTAKITAATAVIYGVSKALSSFINEAAEAEQIENRLKFALETVGYTWQYAKTAVDEFANSIQASTRFSDEQARQALTDMMMYTNDFAKAQMGAKLAMDMSIRTGQDLGSTSRLIGMAMSGNVEMLGRYIPQLRNLDAVLGENATMAQKAEYAMRILSEKFGGTAQADINSYSGQLAQFKNAWSDLKEEIGMGLLPVLKETFSWLTKILKEMKERRELQEGGFFGGWGKAPPGSAYMALGARAKFGIEEGLAEPMKADIFGGGKESDIVKEIQAAIDSVIAAEELRGQVAIAQHELAEGGWSKEKDIVAQVREEIANLERETNEWGEVTVGRQELVEAGWAATAKAEEDAITEGIENARLLHQAWLEAYTAVSQMEIVWNSLGQNISDVWAQNVTNIVKGAENAREALKNIFTGMADAFISAVGKMIMQWLLFETITSGGKTDQKFLSSGSGIGMIVGAIGKVLTLQEGGQFWVNRPTPLLVGEGGQSEFVSVTPKSKMPVGALPTGQESPQKGGRPIIQNFYLVQAVDDMSVRQLFQKNSATFVKIAANDIRSMGILRNAVKGA